MKESKSFLSLRGISKSFGSVKALSNIDLDLYEGEIHTLLGENGAGKSTLINILSGIYTPDSGDIHIKGEKVTISSPSSAKERGIGTVYQHFKLVESMTALENILLGQKSSIFKGKRASIGRILEISERYGLKVDLDKYICDMSLGERQNLEILKVLYRGARLLILDEPTTVYTPQETEMLFRIMNKMKLDGCSIIFISHKMDEVMEISDRITVLRRGESIATLRMFETSPRELTELMVGSSVDLSIEYLEKDHDNPLLQISNLTVVDDEGKTALKNANALLHSGEILGIAGIAGSGQKELCEAIAGIRGVKSGEIIFEGENLSGKNPREFLERGIIMGFIPEDRLGMGLVGSMDIVDNLLLKSYHKGPGLLINRGPTAQRAKELVEELDVRTPGVNSPVSHLSGGNIQKILLGRELGLSPKLLVMAYPLRGLDINTCHTIYRLVNEEKKKGTAVIFVGEDLDVLMQLCDRIAVFSKGNIAGTLDRKNFSRERIGLMMLGVNEGEENSNAV